MKDENDYQLMMDDEWMMNDENALYVCPRGLVPKGRLHV